MRLSRRRRTSAELATVLATLVVAGHAGCSGSEESSVGEVTRVVERTAYVGDKPARRGDKLPAKGVLRTDNSGTVEFELDSGTSCQTNPGSKLDVEPGSGIRIRFRTGRSLCAKRPDAGNAMYGLGQEVVITTKDPVFVVEVGERRTVVSVTLGFVEVETEAAREPVIVGPQQQAVVSSTERAPRVEESELGSDEKRIAKAFEQRLPAVEIDPPANLGEIAEGAVLVVTTDPSAPRSVRSFIRGMARSLAGKWHVSTRFLLVPLDEAKSRLQAGTVDLVATPTSATPSGAMVPLFTRGETIWSFEVSPDPAYERSLRDFVDSSLLTGEYGRLYSDSFATEPKYTRADGRFLVDAGQVPAGTLFSTLPTDRVVEAAGPEGTSDAYPAPAVIQGATVTCFPPPDSAFSIGAQTVNCTAQGPGGVEERTSFKVTVQDRTKPTLNIRGPVVQEAKTTDGAIVAFAITASDSVDGLFDATCAPASRTRFAIGTQEVTCTATDDAGNVARGSFKVTVDDLPPILSVSADLSLPYTSRAGRRVSYRRASARDEVDGPLPATCRPSSGSLFRIGTTTANCFAVDTAGQRTDRSFNVAIVDRVPPELTVPPSRAESAPAGERTHVVTFVTPAVDEIDGEVPVTCTPKSGSRFPVGKTTSVTCTATDRSGNPTEETFSVAVTSGRP
jgi:hypothetical protein